MKQGKLNIAYTVLPKSPISELDWLQLVKAGSNVKKFDSIDKARIMNEQYLENGELNSKYKKLIDSL